MVTTRYKRNGKSSVVLQFAFQTYHPGLQKMLHLFVSTFQHGALISSYISKWWLRAANEMGSQLWCYISLSRYFIQVCEMLHLSGSTFRHGALFSSYITKWWLLHVHFKCLGLTVWHLSTVYLCWPCS